MAITIRELVTRWGFDIDDKPLREMDRKIANLKFSMKAVGAAVAATGGAIFGFVKVTANAGEEALHASQKFGVTVEQYQELAYAAKLANVGSDELGSSLRFLSRNAADAAAKGGDALKPFTDLGIRVTDTNGKIKPTAQLLLEIADRFKAMPDGANKAAMSMQLLGRTGTNLIPLLNGGSEGFRQMAAEARRFGAVLSADTARAGDEFNDSMDRLMTSIKGLVFTIGTEFLPLAEKIVKAMTEWVAQNREWLASTIVQAFQFLVDHGKALVAIFSALAAFQLAGLFASAANSIWLMVAALRTATVQAAVLDTLLGNWPAIVAALAVGGLAYAAATPSGVLGGVMGGGGGGVSASDRRLIQHISFSPQISVVAPSGANPNEFGRGIADALSSPIDRMFRQAQSELTPQLEY